MKGRNLRCLEKATGIFPQMVIAPMIERNNSPTQTNHNTSNSYSLERDGPDDHYQIVSNSGFINVDFLYRTLPIHPFTSHDAYQWPFPIFGNLDDHNALLTLLSIYETCVGLRGKKLLSFSFPDLSMLLLQLRLNRLNKLSGMMIYLEPQTTIYTWMFGETTIFYINLYIKIWNHPIKTTR